MQPADRERRHGRGDDLGPTLVGRMAVAGVASSGSGVDGMAKADARMGKM